MSGISASWAPGFSAASFSSVSLARMSSGSHKNGVDSQRASWDSYIGCFSKLQSASGSPKNKVP